jgi:tetratricopeptide (TPR) repeat protein
MDEQQIHEYQRVIDVLLSCQEGEEAAVYQEFSHLVDTKLLEMMAEVADELEAKGDPNVERLRQERARIAPPLEEWQDLNRQVIELYQSGDIAGAIPLAEDALKLAQRIFTSPNADVATSLNDLAMLYTSQGRWSDAEPLYERALSIRERLFGERPHADVATSLNNLAALHASQGRWSNAELLYERVLAIHKRIFTSPNNDVAASLNNLALLYASQGRWSDAELLYERVLAIHEQLFGERPNADVANSLNNLGMLYASQGRWSDAEPLYERALSIRERLFGERLNADVAASLNNLAALYASQGRWSDAEHLYEQVLAIHERIFTSPNNDVAASLNNLAMLYASQWRWSDAEPLYERALSIRERLCGERPHADVAASLNNLAMLYASQWRWSDAEPLYERALSIRERLFGERPHADLATSLNNLAELYRSQGRWSDAGPLYARALAIYERLFSERPHADLATSLNNLGALYASQRRWSDAEPLHERALSIRERLFGERPNTDLPTSLNDLAMLYAFQGRWSDAEPLYERALAIYERLFGERPNTDLATSLNNLAALYASQGRYSDAIKLLVEANRVENIFIATYFGYATPENQLILLEQQHSSLELFVSFVWKHCHQDPAARSAVLDAILKRKAASTIASSLLNAAQYEDRYPALRPQFEEWQQLKQQLAIGGDRLTDPDRQQLEDKCKQLYQQLASQVPELKTTIMDIDRQAIALYLPANSLLVEFFRFRAFDFKASQDECWQAARYIAFAIAPNTDTPPEIIDLGEAEPIDALIAKYRHVAAADTLTVDKEEEALESEVTTVEELRASILETEVSTGEELRASILDPILKHAPAGTTLILAADGELYRVPFATLPLADSRERVIDRYEIQTLTAARDLRRRQEKIERLPSPSLIVADPDYDCGFAPIESEPSVELEQVLDKCSTSLGGKFKPVPITRLLAESIGNRLQIDPYFQAAATETLFHNQTRSPKYLVVATHGFAADNIDRRQGLLWQKLIALVVGREAEIDRVLQECRNAIDPAFRSAWAGLVTELQSENSPYQQWSEIILAKIDNYLAAPIYSSPSKRFNNPDPMQRCGIALAGANGWLKMQPLSPDIGKGVLLARDIAQLNLWGTEIVVLIACSTALGDTKSGQGIFGLRRALALAGAKHAIVSLWDVPARASMLLMKYFFDAYLAGVAPSAALRQAQNQIRTVTIAQLNESELGREVVAVLKEKHHIGDNTPSDDRPLQSPSYWGAWICQG